jgi:small subunit ribosomal protein S5
MTEEKTTKEVVEAPAAEGAAKAEVKKAADGKEAFQGAPKKRAPRGGRSQGRGERRPRRSFDRPKPEFDQKIISMRRVTRVMAGGRRFSFSVAMLLGDRKGRVAIGVGKSPDTALAIGKAVKDARKNMIKVGLTEDMSIAHEVSAKYASSELSIFPNSGKGLVAGSAVRDMLNLAGVKDVTAKINTRSKNKINIARAVVKALMELPGSEKVKIALEEKRPERKPRTFRKDLRKKS